jgi:hypothetical protein
VWSGWSRNELMELASRSISFRGCGGYSPRLLALCGTLSREPCWLGVECIGCFIRSALMFGRSAGFRTPACEETFERVQSEPVATLTRIPMILFVVTEVSTGIDTCRGSYSVREVKGHERAAAVVHPIKASPQTQDREDRKRSWREHSTNTGARFAGRAL